PHFSPAWGPGGPAPAAAGAGASRAAGSGAGPPPPDPPPTARASYLGERSIGHQDPGATSSSLLIGALMEARDE
ncbi:DAK2 domain-containing protein, partial [Streptomyces mirabilis]|uniref:DAK2 domain-containing protein n=1 Tax=Streptomyces mirabilis TaxID=68239 RepID=UPI003688083E